MKLFRQVPRRDAGMLAWALWVSDVAAVVAGSVFLGVLAFYFLAS